MVRKRFALAGAIFGVAYTMLGMMISYVAQDQVDTLWEVSPWRVLLEFGVFCLFTVPLSGTLGLGIGFLVEGALGWFRRRNAPPQQPSRDA